MRALKQETAKLSISMSVVAPGITTTPILVHESNGNMDPHAWSAHMAKLGVPINKAESVALAVTFLFSQGMQANGAGIFVQADRFSDFERGLAKSRAQWMGKEMLDLFRGGRSAPVYARIEGKL
jgi:NAD(P)-dependent dehydrogenase (short-subunit alcohol dehydrogenase family)